jgi:uncharacterized protein (TIGR03437 family)
VKHDAARSYVRSYCWLATLLLAPILPGQPSPRYETWISAFGGATSRLLTVDSEGHIYISGFGFSYVPTTPNAFAPLSPSLFFPQGYLIELDPTGSSVIYGTFLNGVTPSQIAVDPAGYIYILGDDVEPDAIYPGNPLPVITPNAAQPNPGSVNTPVLLKIAPTGELVYGTYFGGLASYSAGLAVNSNGTATVCGTTVDPGLPVSANAFQPKLNGHGDTFITRISSDGTSFEALTYLGGTGGDFCAGLQVDPSDESVYVYGDTNSRFFPVTAGVYQSVSKGYENLFVSKLDRDLTRLIWSTYIGSGGQDYAQSVALAPDGGLLLSGTTLSMDFPVTPGTTPPYLPAGPFDGSLGGLTSRPFLTVLDPSGSALRSSYIFPFEGGWIGTAIQGASYFGVAWSTIWAISQNATLNAEGMDGLVALGEVYPYPFLVRFDVATNVPTYLGPLRNLNGLNSFGPAGIGVGPNGNVVVAGRGFDASAYNIPGVPYRQLGPSDDQVVAVLNFDFSSEIIPLVTQVVNPASLAASPVSPGQLMQIRGLGFGSSGTTQVLIDGQPVPLISVASDSILVSAPASIAGEPSFQLLVRRDGVSSAERTVPAAAVNPALFTVANTGSGQALASGENQESASPQQPIPKGSRLRLFATGLGAVDPAGLPLATITANVVDLPAVVLATTPAEGYPSGYWAIDIMVPWVAPEGDFVPVGISVNGVASQWGVTVALR